MIKFQRLKKEQKTRKILIKKKTIQTRKINVVVKKPIIVDNKIECIAVCVVKKTLRNEKKLIRKTEKKVS